MGKEAAKASEIVRCLAAKIIEEVDSLVDLVSQGDYNLKTMQTELGERCAQGGAVTNAGNKLILSFPSHVTPSVVVFYKAQDREGNVLNQIGQVVDELLTAERERCIQKLIEIIPMADPELTTIYLRDALAKP